MKASCAVLVLSIALPACAASTPPEVVEMTAPPSIVHPVADRMILLADGSELLFYRPLLPDGQPPQMEAYLYSARSREEDRSFRLSIWIPDEVMDGSHTQIRSAAMSSDHTRLAFVGGWAGVHDHRGHNAIFVVKQNVKSRYWRVESWFDVPGAILGDIVFGPDDTLAVLSQRDAAGPVPLLTIYSYGGQNLGAFLPAEHHGETIGARHTLMSRLVLVNEHELAMLDTESNVVRQIELVTEGKSIRVRQTRLTRLPFSIENTNIIGFEPRADGSAAIARTVARDSKGKSDLVVVSPDGSIASDWNSPEVWSYGYVRAGLVRAYSHGSAGTLRLSTVIVP